MYDLKGKAAIVTGAAQGIGFGIARELARAGCRVVIADRDVQKADAAVEDLKRQGHEAISVALDVTDDASVSACAQASIERFSRIDILVNNAGIHCEKLGQVSKVEHFNKCFDVNLVGVWRMTQALMPHFKAQGGGRVVNIASINGRKPWVDTPAYSASKAAVINLTQSLATTLGQDHINVNAVCPGGVITAMADFFKEERPNIAQAIIDARLLKRPLLPGDIGAAVVFLSSPQAKSITGQSLNVDGGCVFN